MITANHTPPRKKETAEEIEYAWGERVLYYPYLDPQPVIQSSPGIYRQVIGENLNGEPIYQYKVNDRELEAHYFPPGWWKAAHQAKRGTAEQL